MDNGPGTPIARLSNLLNELDKRFPGVVNPLMSDPPEPKYLAAIDRALNALKWIAEWSDKDMSTARTLHYDMSGKAKEGLSNFPDKP